MVGIRVRRDGEVQRAVQAEAQRCRATDVAEVAFEQREVWCPRIMHVQARLLHGKGEVRPRDS